MCTRPYYSPCMFAIHTKELVDSEHECRLEYYPAFVHEYMHYLQEISHLSSVMGFYAYICDVCSLTKYYANGTGQVKEIPIPQVEIDRINLGFRKFWLLREGSSESSSFGWDKIENCEIVQDNYDMPSGAIPYSKVKLTDSNNIEFILGLGALNELHSYYAQKIVEGLIHEQKPSVAFAYNNNLWAHEVDNGFFKYFNVEIDIQQKYLLLDLCLNTQHPSEILLSLLEKLQNLDGIDCSINEYIIGLVSSFIDSNTASTVDVFAVLNCSLTNTRISQSVTQFNDSLHWYQGLIKAMKNIRTENATFFLDSLLAPSKLNKLIMAFPPPILIVPRNEAEDILQFGDKLLSAYSFDNALYLYTLFHVFKLITRTNYNDFQQLAKCPLVPSNDSVDSQCECYNSLGEAKRYCKEAHWTNLKEKLSEGTTCYMAIAYNTFGLFQNEIEFNIDNLT